MPSRFGRAVITGGAGFLGSHLCERLLGQGVEVICLDNFITSTPDNVSNLLEHRRFQLVRCDATDFIHVPGPVDLVLHLASPASPADYLRLPIHTMKVGSIGTLHALGIAKEKQAITTCGSTSPIHFVPRPVDDPSRRRPDTRLIESTLGWRPSVPFDAGVAATIEWFRAIADRFRQSQA